MLYYTTIVLHGLACPFHAHTHLDTSCAIPRHLWKDLQQGVEDRSQHADGLQPAGGSAEETGVQGPVGSAEARRGPEDLREDPEPHPGGVSGGYLSSFPQDLGHGRRRPSWLGGHLTHRQTCMSHAGLKAMCLKA